MVRKDIFGMGKEKVLISTHSKKLRQTVDLRNYHQITNNLLSTEAGITLRYGQITPALYQDISHLIYFVHGRTCDR